VFNNYRQSKNPEIELPDPTLQHKDHQSSWDEFKKKMQVFLQHQLQLQFLLVHKEPKLENIQRKENILKIAKKLNELNNE